MWNMSGNMFWSEGIYRKSSLGIVQIFSDKTAMTLKSIALAAYPVHAVLLNSSALYRKCSVENGLPLV